MALYGYTRVSTGRQAEDGESLDVQGRRLEGWALMQGIPITDMMVEGGVSGSVPVKERPAGAKLWAKLQPGDTVVAAKLDRMFRSALDALQMVEELKAMGVSLVLLDLGADPVTNGLSKLFLTIAAAFAEAERDRIRERVSQVKKDQRDRSRYLGGIVPFGYVVDAEGQLQPVEEDQAIIAKAKALKASGVALRKIQATIAEEDGRAISLGGLHKMLKA
jgi:putative DNA-invertase from lambdoid prophage Rac